MDGTWYSNIHIHNMLKRKKKKTNHETERNHVSTGQRRCCLYDVRKWSYQHNQHYTKWWFQRNTCNHIITFSLIFTSCSSYHLYVSSLKNMLQLMSSRAYPQTNFSLAFWLTIKMCMWVCAIFQAFFLSLAILYSLWNNNFECVCEH